MSQTGTLKMVKRAAIALVVLGVALTAVSCGQQGNIYGDVIWDGALYYTIGGGFPSSGVVYGATYLILEVAQGGEPHEYVVRSLERFAKYVMPAFNGNG